MSIASGPRTVNDIPPRSTSRTLEYFRNLKRSPNQWGNWRRDPSTNILEFNGGWYIDLGDLTNGTDAFHAMADFAKFALVADDIADLGRALRKTIPEVLS